MSTFYSELASLLRTGLPLPRALELVAGHCWRRDLAAILLEARAKVAEGVSLADAMALHPGIFADTTVEMVRAGEQEGTLADALDCIAHVSDLRPDRRILAALAVPILLAVFGFLAINIVMIFVLP